ncbi:MAG: YggT family protein [Clostridia bacterium]|nr:YggT family protein [Clostridia bacterium]
MEELFFIVSRTVVFFLDAIMFLLLARVLISFFTDEESSFYNFCCVVTEPVVSPVRGLLSRIPALEDSPIDFSFVATSFIVLIVQAALPL